MAPLWHQSKVIRVVVPLVVVGVGVHDSSSSGLSLGVGGPILNGPTIGCFGLVSTKGSSGMVVSPRGNNIAIVVR